MAEPRTPDDSRPDLPTATWSGGAGARPSIPHAPIPQTPIGPYRLLEKLGEGGFGEVYVADQSEPVRRRVALKILKAGMDTKAVLARFEAERQALARMDHPNIATVLDAGVTEQGRSYFVMELVDGEPITAYCDRHALTIAQRLELFILVCNAVQHAHQKGIIHRDLKPSNILVTIVDDRAMPKVIDFGIAKATSDALTDETIRTMQGELMGTPEYMSPEQAEMGALDVDTRADIYSLGVVLYELLSGELPFESAALRRGGLSELHRIIREQEPQRPSTKLTASGKDSAIIAKNRQTEVRTLARMLRDDLDWVVLKALEKDRARRYESASAMAQEIRRYLNHEPLLAGPPGAQYRMAKFMRRHRAAVVAGTVVGLALLVGIAGLAFGLVKARQAEANARREAATTSKVLDFMIGLFNVSDPSEARGNSITAREILDKGVAEIGTGLEAEPLVQARLMMTMGNVYGEMGLLQQSRPLLEQSLAIRERHLPAGDRQIASGLQSLANVVNQLGDYAAARSMYERAIAINEKALGPDDPEVALNLSGLGTTLIRIGDYPEAQRAIERALAIRERAFGPDDQAVASTITVLADLFHSLGRYDEAMRAAERALAIREKVFGQDHPAVAQALNNLGSMYWGVGDFAAAKGCWERVVAISEKQLGPEHPDLAVYLSNLGGAHYALEDYASAKKYFERALAIHEKTLGPNHSNVAVMLGNLGGALQEMGDIEGAIPLLERALAISEKALGAEHPHVGVALSNLGGIYTIAGDLRRARECFDRSAAIYAKALPPDHPLMADHLDGQAALFRKTGDVARAEEFEARAKAIRDKTSAAASAGGSS